MKAILVIDAPKDCGDCPCIEGELWFCKADKESRECLYHGRPDWCPLKPMPQKEKPRDPDETWDEMMQRFGRNGLIDEIIGETE